MISTLEALDIIRGSAQSFGIETVPLQESLGRILKEDWHTDRALPPYDRVTMDGIAIRYEDFISGNRTYTIQGLCAAGMAQQNLINGCLEVMTGAVMPSNADVVIRYEDVVINGKEATVQLDTIKQFQNVHFAGSDSKIDALVVPSNSLIGTPEIGTGATIGKHTVQVAKMPKAIIISTGDELVPIDKNPAAHQIRRSNVHSIAATLAQWNIKADLTHLDDNKEEILNAFSGIFSHYELIIISGGVSKGKLDFIPDVLDELGVDKKFHKVRQRPGKPFWFGQKDKATIFALPGNPVSSFICAQRYVKYWLDHCLIDKEFPKTYAVLSQNVSFKPELTLFLEVSLESREDGQLLAIPARGNGSGDLANLNKVDGFMELPAGKTLHEAGGVYPVYAVR